MKALERDGREIRGVEIEVCSCRSYHSKVLKLPKRRIGSQHSRRGLSLTIFVFWRYSVYTNLCVSLCQQVLRLLKVRAFSWRSLFLGPLFPDGPDSYSCRLVQLV